MKLAVLVRHFKSLIQYVRPLARAWDTVRPQLPHYVALTRIDRPVGIFLLLWPTWWALVIAAGGMPDLWVVMVFTAGVILTRSAGCVINDFADRNFDGSVRRTRDRPLASGKVSTREAALLFVGLMGLAFLLVLTLNRLTILLSFIAILLAMSYPFAKRYTYLPQFHLGLAFGWGIPMAFAAERNDLPPVAWLLLVANILWSAVYDTMYAMVDREDDLRIGIKSTAILFDDADRLIIGVMQGMMLLTLWLVGSKEHLGGYYHLGLVVAAGLCIYHQYLIRDRDPDGCFRAFRHNNWVGAAVFAGLVLNFAMN